MKKVLVLEDEANICSFAVANLKWAGYEAIEVEIREEALAQLKHNPNIKAALLDIMLSDMDGSEVCRHIRVGDNSIGIIMLTTRTQEMDKATGLVTGADDYVTKPFSPAEFTTRIDVLYRCTGEEDPANTDEISQLPFLLSTRNRTLEKSGQRVKPTQVEYPIIKLFMDNLGKVLSREEILDSVWRRDYLGKLKIVDVNIRRLRIKIEGDPINPAYITTVWGYGYKWGFQSEVDGAFSMGPALGRGGAERHISVSARSKSLDLGQFICPGRREKRDPRKALLRGV